MKRFYENNKKIVIALLLSCLALAGIGAGTLAYYSSVTAQRDNTITIGNVTSEIHEEVAVSGRTITKQVYVTNTGANDCFVRLRVQASPSDGVNGAVTVSGDKWTSQNSDGFYYYTEKIAPNSSTGKITVTAVIKDAYTGDFQITCYQESVQAEMTVEGVKETDRVKIWEAYDSNANVFATKTSE